ncbi:MAG: thioredoxin domain-containing protein [Oligoflexales bacterium]
MSMQRAMIFLILIGAIGFGFSSYSILHHQQVQLQGTTDAACNINSSINCDAIANSAYSEFFGQPLGQWGQGFFTAFIFYGILISLGQVQNLLWLTLLVALGCLTTLALGALSFSLGSLCLICLGVYASILSAAGVLFQIRGHITSSSPDHLIKNIVLSGFLLASGLIWAPATWFSNLEDIAPPKLKDFSAPLLATEQKNIPISTSKFSGLGEDYRWGSDSAKAVIVEFSDFQCPACGNMSHTLSTLKKEFGDGLLIVYKNYPLDNSCNKSMQRGFHEHACLAATLARCAGEYQKFSDMHDKIFANQSQMNESNLIAWAKDIGLNQDQISTCQTSQAIQDKISEDISLGNSLGVQGTPSLFLNGRKVLDSRLSSLRTAVQAYLKN